jgi:hypothetical protein
MFGNLLRSRDEAFPLALVLLGSALKHGFHQRGLLGQHGYDLNSLEQFKIDSSPVKGGYQPQSDSCEISIETNRNRGTLGASYQAESEFISLNPTFSDLYGPLVYEALASSSQGVFPRAKKACRSIVTSERLPGSSPLAIYFGRARGRSR